VQDGGHHAFTGEAVERPEQRAIELALVGIIEQCGEPFAAVYALPAALVVDVLANKLMTGIGALFSQLSDLVRDLVLYRRC
jgi:hypothetical protein